MTTDPTSLARAACLGDRAAYAALLTLSAELCASHAERIQMPAALRARPVERTLLILHRALPTHSAAHSTSRWLEAIVRAGAAGRK